MTDGSDPIMDMTLSRVDTVINLLLLAGAAATWIRREATPDHARLHAAMVTSALDEALAEQRILSRELAASAASRSDSPDRSGHYSAPDSTMISVARRRWTVSSARTRLDRNRGDGD
jgi:hypothetical protein